MLPLQLDCVRIECARLQSEVFKKRRNTLDGVANRVIRLTMPFTKIVENSSKVRSVRPQKAIVVHAGSYLHA